MILNPSRNVTIESIVKTWNLSLEKDEIDRDHDHIFKSAIERGAISNKNFTKYSAYARMVLFLSDKNRVSTYQFTYQDYIMRRELYFPIGYTDFGSLPPGYNPFVPSEENTSPTVWMINLAGIIKLTLLC